MNAPSSDHEAIVIGAGQAGLAAGYHLARRGIDFTVLEAGRRVGDVWRERYDSLLLYSPAKYNALPGLPFSLAAHAFPTGRQMADYLEAYADHHKLPVETGVRVDCLRASNEADGAGRFAISAGNRRYEASQVIVATGAFQRPHVPELAGRLDPGIRQLHSADYRGPHQLADGPVLVVGLSHSGADIAHEVANAGHRTFLSGRAHGQLPFSVDSRRARLAWPLMRFVASNVLTLSTPIGRKMEPKVRAGGGPLLRVRRRDLEAVGVTLYEARTIDVDGRGRPELADGTVLDVENVVWCTGFRPDYGWIELPVIGEDGWPRERRGVVDVQPGLYFLGIPFLYSFTSMLVLGAGRDAAYVVDRLAARRADRSHGVTAKARSTAADDSIVWTNERR
jgi:putative flavoprotein involved in K+ transport